jgi:hypothetical protein
MMPGITTAEVLSKVQLAVDKYGAARNAQQ